MKILSLVSLLALSGLALTAADRKGPPKEAIEKRNNGRQKADLDCGAAAEVSGNKRNVQVKCTGKGKMVHIRSFSKDQNKKAGFIQTFDVLGGPSFAYRYFSDVSGVKSEDSPDVNFEGLRMAFTRILEVNAANETQAELKLVSKNWSPVNVSKATVGAATYISASSSFSGVVKSKTVKVVVEAQSSLDDSTTAGSINLLQDSLKWNVNISNWDKAEGNKLVLWHHIHSTRTDFDKKAAPANTEVAVGNAKLSWESSAFIDGSTPVDIKFWKYDPNPPSSESEVPEGETAVERPKEDKFQVLAMVVDTTAAFTEFAWDPAVGAPSNDAVDQAPSVSSGEGTTPAPTTEKAKSAAPGANLRSLLAAPVILVLASSVAALIGGAVF